MRNSLWMIVIVAFSIMTSGCAHKSLYRNWGEQISEMPRHDARVEDVSMLLGVLQTRCEPVEAQQPLIGIRFDSDKTMVTSVRSNSPAQIVGILPGDTIISVNNKSVANKIQLNEILRLNARDGEPLRIVTSRGSVEVIPKLPKAEQCYWEVQAGQVARVGSGAYVNQWGGAASSGGSAYQRFFRTSCRIYDGFLAGCKSNWQE